MGITEKYRPDIDGLRAIAVTVMILHHAWPALIPTPAGAVDIFFVISGYLITASVLNVLKTDKFRLRDFYYRRVRRIFPTLLVVLTTTFGLGWAVLLPDEFRLLSKHTLSALAFVINFVLRGESGYWDVSSQSKPLLHLWTLSLEEQFYVVWPLVLLFSYRYFRKVTPVIVGVIILSFGFFLGLDSDDYYFFTHARLWAIAAGGLMAALPLRKIPWSVALISLAILLVSFFYAPGKWQHVIATGATLLIIQCGLTSKNFVNDRILSARPLVYVGLMSFPLYLWHWPFLSGARILTNNNVTDVMKVAILLLSVFLGVLTHEWLEKPFHRMNPVKATRWLLPAALILGLVSGACYFFDVGSYRELKFGDAPLREYDIRMARNPKYQRELLVERYRPPHFCHMFTPENTFEEYLRSHEACLKFSHTLKNIVILGDSLAEEIHAALVLTHPEYNFLHFSGTSCSPIRTVKQSPACLAIAEYGLKLALDPRTSAVIYASQWTKAYPQLLPDIDLLKSRGKKVILAGPSMAYKDEIPNILGHRSPRDTVWTLSQKMMSPEQFPFNEQIRDWSEAHNIEYIDKMEIFCPKRHCEFISPEGIPYYRDNVHLLKEGLLILGEGIRKQKKLSTP